MASSTPNVLSADSIISCMTKSLPSHNLESQRLVLKDQYAAIALFSHACMLAVGFRLIGLGEDHTIDAHSNQRDISRLPAEWDNSSTYAFRYAHSQSSMEYLVKISRLGNKAIIFGIGLGDDKTAQFEIKAQDYISEGSQKESGTNSDIASALRNTFISPGRITDLTSLFRLNIIQKLTPGIYKEGYEDQQTSSAGIRQSRTERDGQSIQPNREPPREPLRDPLRGDLPDPARPYPFHDPLAAAPRRPNPPDFAPPGFEDEYDMTRPPQGMPGRTPFGNIGERDLYPPGLGPNDPLRMGPGGGLRGGGGMHPTFDDQLFGGQGGGGGYDPRAPPGARYDPVGPSDGPRMGRGGGFPGRGGFGGGGNPFGGFRDGDFI